jgi:hypothetical protein
LTGAVWLLGLVRLFALYCLLLLRLVGGLVCSLLILLGVNWLVGWLVLLFGGVVGGILLSFMLDLVIFLGLKGEFL